MAKEWGEFVGGLLVRLIMLYLALPTMIILGFNTFFDFSWYAGMEVSRFVGIGLILNAIYWVVQMGVRRERVMYEVQKENLIY